MQEGVIQAVQYFIDNDPELLELSAHEQAISHRIAVYLEQIFVSKNLNIDCEYNKHLDDPKRINLYDLNLDSYASCGCDACKKVISRDLNEIPDKDFRPDIVLHSRGNDMRNFLVIEIKKSKECPFDEIKLKALTKSKNSGGEYGYELGVFISFPKNKPKFKWFVSGQQV